MILGLITLPTEYECETLLHITNNMISVDFVCVYVCVCVCVLDVQKKVCTL